MPTSSRTVVRLESALLITAGQKVEKLQSLSGDSDGHLVWASVSDKICNKKNDVNSGLRPTSVRA